MACEDLLGWGNLVGGATLELLRRLGYDAVGYDIDKRKSEVEELPVADIYFVCTPETVVEEVVSSLPDSEFVVVRSTVPPGTTRRLMAKFKRHVSHLPEFLREATALYDALRPSRIVIGECCKKHGDLLEEIFGRLYAPIVRVDPTTSEMIKLASNAFLATAISFWNEIHLICRRLGVNSHVVGRAAAMDPRIPDYGAVQHGRPYGGRCLPKDVRQLLKLCEELGYEPRVLKAVHELNEAMSHESVSSSGWPRD